MASMSNTEVPSDQTSLTLPKETEDKEGDQAVGTPTKLDEKVEQPAGDESSPTQETAEVEYPQGLRLGAIVVALILAIFLVSLDLTIVATAIPKITDQFHSLDDVGWYASAFFLTVAAFQSTWVRSLALCVIYKHDRCKVEELLLN